MIHEPWDRVLKNAGLLREDMTAQKTVTQQFVDPVFCPGVRKIVLKTYPDLHRDLLYVSFPMIETSP
jgi:iron only hydrogenase large subunit-like protein